MKNNFLPFLLGIFVALSFAATTPNLLTVRPAKPKSTVRVTSFEDAKLYIKNGYIIKSAGGGDYHQFIILEKY